jgi:intracellular sulfur oxidation DsrE/DsrF family protein
MTAKAVFHLDWEKEENLVMALNNMANLFRAVPAEEASIRLLANGAAVKLFLKDRALQHGRTMEGLSKQGVRFMVCSNSLKKFNMQQTELVAFCDIVPAGIVELIQLQNEGYAYIKP